MVRRSCSSEWAKKQMARLQVPALRHMLVRYLQAAADGDGEVSRVLTG
jgi:hypothetical protein